MKSDHFKVASIIFTLIMVVVLSAVRSAADDVARITKEELKILMSNPDLVILDVRKSSHWDSSDYKITGAMRDNTNDMDSFAKKYMRNKTFVLYCA